MSYTNVYGLKTAPEWRPRTADTKQDPALPPLWSGAPAFPAPPAVGARVFARGGFGASTVTGYFVEHGYLGVELRPTVLPDWFRKQSPRLKTVKLFGAEIDKLSEEAPPAKRPRRVSTARADREAHRREIAMEEGMLGGCDAYNEVMGY